MSLFGADPKDERIADLQTEVAWLRAQLEEKDKSLMAMTNPAVFLARYGRPTRPRGPEVTGLASDELKVLVPQRRDVPGSFRPQKTRSEIEDEFQTRPA